MRQVALADQIRITKLDLRDDKESAASRLLLELRRINPSAEIGEIDWSSPAVARLLTIAGFDTSDPLADPRPWLNVQAYQKVAEIHHHR